MFCAISGKPTRQPVLSPVSNYIFDKNLIEQYVDANNTDPINNKPLKKEQLIKINNSITDNTNTLSALNNSSTLNANYSIPNILSTLQNEWDAIMLENFQLRKSLNELNRTLSTTLYERDAAKLIASNLLEELNSRKRGVQRQDDTIKENVKSNAKQVVLQFDGKSHENNSPVNESDLDDEMAGINAEEKIGFPLNRDSSINKINSDSQDSIELPQNIIAVANVDKQLVIDQSLTFMNQTKDQVKRQTATSQSYNYKNLTNFKTIDTIDISYNKGDLFFSENYNFLKKENTDTTTSSSYFKNNNNNDSTIVKNVYWMDGNSFFLLNNTKDHSLSQGKLDNSKITLFEETIMSLIHFDYNSQVLLQLDSETHVFRVYDLKYNFKNGESTSVSFRVPSYPESNIIKILKHESVQSDFYYLVSEMGQVYQLSINDRKLYKLYDTHQTITDASLHKDGLLLALYSNDSTYGDCSDINIINLSDPNEPATVIDNINPAKIKFAMNGYWLFVQDIHNNFTVLDLRKQPLRKITIDLQVENVSPSFGELIWDINDVGTCMVVLYRNIFYIYQYDKSLKNWSLVEKVNLSGTIDSIDDDLQNTNISHGNDTFRNLQILNYSNDMIDCLVHKNSSVHYITLTK